MIQIFTDTSANLPASYIQKYALRVIPLTYLIDGVEAHQDPTVDFDGKAYYDAMRSGTSVTTAMINIAGFLEPLREALAAGDDAIYIGMSGGISGHGTRCLSRCGGAEGRIPGAEGCLHRHICRLSRRGAARGRGCAYARKRRVL